MAQYEINFDVADALTASLISLLTTVDTPIPFENGAAAVNFDTALGEIEGTIDFAGGDLDLDLSTPLGSVDTSIDFPENTQFAVPLNFGLFSLDLELDLVEGIISIPPFFGQTIEVPLENVSGELAFSDGLASLQLDAGLPIPIETTFEVEPFVETIAIELLEDLSGNLTLNAGVIDGLITSRLGEYPISASVDDLVLQASTVIDQTSGTLTLRDGSAGINLDTPLGEIFGSIAFDPIEGMLGTVPTFLT